LNRRGTERAKEKLLWREARLVIEALNNAVFLFASLVFPWCRDKF
jgi:hypothetical protein